MIYQLKVLPWTCLYIFVCVCVWGGSMFVDNQNFAILLGYNFVGNWFVALQCNMIHYALGYTFRGT